MDNIEKDTRCHDREPIPERDKIDAERHGVILEPSILPFENRAVLNPTTYQDETGRLHMFYRAVAKDGVSCVGYCAFQDDRLIERATSPLLKPDREYERLGIEDPRLTRIEDTYYMAYTGWDGTNARVCLATSRDLRTWQKHGIISPNINNDVATEILRHSPVYSRYAELTKYRHERAGGESILWDKDAVLFPKKIGGKFAMLHRILPDIQLALFDSVEELQDDEYWLRNLNELYRWIVIDSRQGFESRNVGAGAPPIETDKGWLLIYHGVEQLTESRRYSMGVALLDKNDPTRVLGRLSSPALAPEESYELSGDVNNVVFPTAAAIQADQLRVYYGAADTRICSIDFSLSKLLERLADADIND